MNNDKFEVKLIAKGSFVDSEPGNLFLVETYTIRLNHIALNDWLLSECHNCRECYIDGEVGDAQWKAYQAERAELRKMWTDQIIAAIAINVGEGSICITQALSEVFTVVHITEMEQEHGGIY